MGDQGSSMFLSKMKESEGKLRLFPTPTPKNSIDDDNRTSDAKTSLRFLSVP